MYTILIVLIAIIAVLLLAAAVLPKDYSISQDITINQSRQVVFDYVKHLKNQNQYNKWVMTDPNVRISYTGTDGTVGFEMAWDSDIKNVGQGKQEIKQLAENERVDIEIEFIKPFTGIAQTVLQTKGAGNITNVIWTMQGNTPFPMNLMTTLMKGMLAKDLAASLNNLKKVLER